MSQKLCYRDRPVGTKVSMHFKTALLGASARILTRVLDTSASFQQKPKDPSSFLMTHSYGVVSA